MQEMIFFFCQVLIRFVISNYVINTNQITSYWKRKNSNEPQQSKSDVTTQIHRKI